MEQASTANETQIQELINARIRAIGAKDIEALLSNHAADVLSFDVIGPLRNRGAAAILKRAKDWFGAYQSPIGYEVRDLEVTAGADVAFCTYLYHVSGTLHDGGHVNMWVRATVCLCKPDGAWSIVHEHQSVPFDGKTGQASLDLKP